MKKFLFSLIILICISCGGVSNNPNSPDPYNPPPENALCVKVCYHYEWMGCDEAKPTPENHSCKEVCENLVSSLIPGINEYYNCVLKTNTCENARKCE